MSDKHLLILGIRGVPAQHGGFETFAEKLSLFLVEQGTLDIASSPVIALTGKKPPLWQYRNSYQEIHHWPMFEPVTKYNADVIAPEQLPHLLRQAFREAVSGKPGPVYSVSMT